MSAPHAKLLVSTADQAVWIKIVGRANFAIGVDFKTLVNELRQAGQQRYIIDLTECALMDSTFLGVLTGFALKLGASGSGTPNGSIELLNPNSVITDLLDNLCMVHLFKLVTGAPQLPESAMTVRPQAPQREVDLTRTSLEAHETLMKAAPENVDRFKDVTQFLAEDLKRMKGAEGAD